MLVPALIVGLIALIGRAESRFGANLFIEEPIVLCTITGLFLGDLQTGLIIGGTLQLVFLGNLGIGGAQPADSVLGSVLSTAIAILSGQGLEVAVALAVPVAALAQALIVFARGTFNAAFVRRAYTYANKGDPDGISRMHLSAGIVYCILTAFIPAFLAILAGVPAVEAVLDVLPPVIISGLQASSMMLRALGFAILFTQMYQKKYLAFFAVGFLAVTYLNLSTIAIAAFAVCVAAIYYLMVFRSDAINKEGGLEQ